MAHTTNSPLSRSHILSDGAQHRDREGSLTESSQRLELSPRSQYFVDPFGTEVVKHRGSTDSEDAMDPEPDYKDSMPPAVYSELIRTAMTEVRKQIDANDWAKAEIAQIKAIQYLQDREAKLHIPFETRTQMVETLADINIKQKKYELAKVTVSDLLRRDLSDDGRKWALYHMLAQIYLAQSRLDEAEKFAKRAYIGREKTLGKGHAMILQSSSLLISIYDKMGDPESVQALRNLHPEAYSADAHPQQTFKHVGTTRVSWTPDLTMDMNAWTKTGKTILINAIVSGDEEIVAQALNGGADVERRCDQEITPLMYTIIHNQEQIAGVLLSRGADVNAKTFEWSPLHKACDQDEKNFVELLLEHGANTELRAPRTFKLASILATQNGSEAIPTESNVEAEEEESAAHAQTGWTPLLRTAFRGQASIARLLLERGAAIEARNPSGNTALACAVDNHHPETVSLLLARGANANFHDNFGWTLLHRAQARRGSNSLRIATALLTLASPRVNPDAKCEKGMTVLHHAVERDNEAMIPLLLQHGANVSAVDLQRRTPLHTAIEARRENMVHLLLQHGADTSAKDLRGHDALSAAKVCVRRSPEIVRMLEIDQQRRKEGRSSTPSLSARFSKITDLTSVDLEKKKTLPLGSTALSPPSSLSPQHTSPSPSSTARTSQHHPSTSTNTSLSTPHNPTSSSSTSSILSPSTAKDKKKKSGKKPPPALSEREIESLGMLGIAAKGSGLSSAAAANRPRDTRPDLPSNGGIFRAVTKRARRKTVGAAKDGDTEGAPAHTSPTSDRHAPMSNTQPPTHRGSEASGGSENGVTKVMGVEVVEVEGEGGGEGGKRVLHKKSDGVGGGGGGEMGLGGEEEGTRQGRQEHHGRKGSKALGGLRWWK